MKKNKFIKIILSLALILNFGSTHASNANPNHVHLFVFYNGVVRTIRVKKTLSVSTVLDKFSRRFNINGNIVFIHDGQPLDKNQTIENSNIEENDFLICCNAGLHSFSDPFLEKIERQDKILNLIFELRELEKNDIQLKTRLHLMDLISFRDENKIDLQRNFYQQSNSLHIINNNKTTNGAGQLTVLPKVRPSAPSTEPLPTFW